MSAPTSSPQIVGRGPELAVLGDALDAGRSGHPRAVIVRGEAGIGKTRLLQEFLAEATRRATAAPRLVIATGQCVDLGPIGAPFTPIRRLLHELHGGVGDSVFREAARTPAVVATLSTLLPDLAADADVPPGTADYIAEGIERIIENLSADHHLLLVIEDLHWADTATLALLKTLAVTLRGKHVTLVMTYRADDVGRQHPLRPVLAEFDRSRAVTGLEVARLTPDDIAVQVRMLTGRDPDPAALDRIAQRSDGVPFFVEELVGLGDAALPETLRDLVLARADRLSPAARRLVGVAAAGGVRVDHALLVAVAGGDPAALDDSIREAIAAGVFVPDGDGYAFRHALIHEAVHDELLVGERLSLHRRYAEELQRRVDVGEPAVAAEAAEQWIAAREDVRAFATTAIAMREARSELAWAAEAGLGERLLALWDRVPDPEQVVGSSRMAVAERVMTGLDAIGDAKRLVRIADEALSHGADADPVEGARVRLQSATVRQGLGEDVRPLLLESLELVEHLDTPAAKAMLSSALSLLGGIGFGPHATSSMREELVDRAIVVAEESGDNDALSRALRRRAFAVIESGHWEGLADDLVRAAALASDPVGRGTAITNHTDLLLRLGRYREAIELGLPAWEESVALGVERGVGAFILANVVEAQLALGEAADGLENARRAQALLPDQLYFFSYIMRAQALTACWDDRPTDADAILSAHPELVALGASDNDELFGWAHVTIDRALIDAETADAADRGGLVRHALDTATSVMTEENDEAWALRVPLLASVAWSVRAAGTVVADVDTSDLRNALDRAQAALYDEGRDAAMRTLVAAELADDLAGWRAALAAADLGTTPVRHRHVSRYRLAQALIEVGDREEAVDLLERIVAEASGNGVTVVARWARELASRAGMTLEGSDAAAAASGVSTLTRRELQVLALVAEGLTNPQIGQRLFISPKTASVHVSAILAKIGVANRAEAAALYAADKPS